MRGVGHTAYKGIVHGYGLRTLTVFLLDDHDIVRRGLRDLLTPARDIVIVGESDSAERAMQLIPDLNPDVMLLDVQLQDGTGIEVCRHVRSGNPAVRGLMLTSAGDDEAMLAAILAGASGYLIKLTTSSAVTDALRRVGAGQSLMDAHEQHRIIDRLRRNLTASDSALVGPVERDVLSCILDGASDAEIAHQLGIPPEDVRACVGRLTESLVGLPFSIWGPPSPGSGSGKHRRPDA